MGEEPDKAEEEPDKEEEERDPSPFKARQQQEDYEAVMMQEAMEKLEVLRQ